MKHADFFGFFQILRDDIHTPAKEQIEVFERFEQLMSWEKEDTAADQHGWQMVICLLEPDKYVFRIV